MTFTSRHNTTNNFDTHRGPIRLPHQHCRRLRICTVTDCTDLPRQSSSYRATALAAPALNAGVTPVHRAVVQMLNGVLITSVRTEVAVTQEYG